MIAVMGRDYGPMLKAERRARKTGKLVADGSIPLASKELTEMEIKEDIPLRAYNAIIPVLTVIIMVIVGLYINGRGAVFGDHCSPISDTTIMSSMASASDHIDHVKTQIPYSITVAIIALLVGYLPTAILGINPWISLAVGLALAYLVIKFYGQEVEAPEFMKEV